MNANVETFVELATHAVKSGRQLQSRTTILRLHTVLGMLRKAGEHGMSAPAIATRLEVKERTIYRDIDTLRSMGLEIRSQSEGWPVDGYALAPKN